MSPHLKSAFQEDGVRYAAAMEDGVCLAIDALLELGQAEAADLLFSALFVPRAPAGSTYSTAPKAPPEEHILP